MKNLIVFLLCFPLMALAQKSHTVGPKESLFSIGRQYNIHPRELAAYNNISFETGLTIGQVLKIPARGNMPVPPAPSAGKTEPVVKAAPVKEAGSIPIYHKVAKKETLYHISTLYNKVPVADIKKWNNLSGDALNEGANLIVGYRRSGNEVATASEAQQKEAPAKLPAVNNPKAPEIRDVISNPVTGKKIAGGAFKTVYSSQSNSRQQEKGMAGIFKSTSGWEDGKYYCLHNAAQAGAIIKITNPVNNKAVYAKVLDVIPDLTQNDGLVLRLSNAAADELGVGTSNFECVINY